MSSPPPPLPPSSASAAGIAPTSAAPSPPAPTPDRNSRRSMALSFASRVDSRELHDLRPELGEPLRELRVDGLPLGVERAPGAWHHDLVRDDPRVDRAHDQAQVRERALAALAARDRD